MVVRAVRGGGGSVCGGAGPGGGDGPGGHFEVRLGGFRFDGKFGK